MIKKIVVLAFLAKAVFAFNLVYGGLKNPQKPVFCGKAGHLYDITEPDMWKEIVQKAKDVNKTYLYNYARKEINRAFVMDNTLPYCSMLKIRRYEPIFTLKHDLYANGVLLYKKGYSFNILERLNSMSAQKPLLYFGSLDNNVSKNIGIYLVKKYSKTIFSVLKGNFKKLAYKYPYKVAVSNNRLINQFQVHCNSTVVVLGKKYLYIIEIPVNKLKKSQLKQIYNKIDKLYKEYYEDD